MMDKKLSVVEYNTYSEIYFFCSTVLKNSFDFYIPADELIFTDMKRKTISSNHHYPYNEIIPSKHEILKDAQIVLEHFTVVKNNATTEKFKQQAMNAIKRYAELINIIKVTDEVCFEDKFSPCQAGSHDEMISKLAIRLVWCDASIKCKRGDGNQLKEVKKIRHSINVIASLDEIKKTFPKGKVLIVDLKRETIEFLPIA